MKKNDSQLQLRNNVAIVTGGASGIGEAICHELASQGAAIAIADVDLHGAQTVAEDINHNGGKAITLEVDVTDYQKVTEFANETLKILGTIDILVNSAGVNRFLSPEDITMEQWKQVLSINLDGPWNFCRAVMPEMKRKRSGKIINIASGAGLLAIPKAAHYTSSKHGLVGLTKALAVDLGPYNINVNCICPGTTLTPLVEKALNQTFKIEQVKRIPLGRLGKPSDIAKAALFFATQASDWITGVALPVDGGLVCCIRAHHME